MKLEALDGREHSQNSKGRHGEYQRKFWSGLAGLDPSFLFLHLLHVLHLLMRLVKQPVGFSNFLFFAFQLVSTHLPSEWVKVYEEPLSLSDDERHDLHGHFKLPFMYLLLFLPRRNHSGYVHLNHGGLGNYIIGTYLQQQPFLNYMSNTMLYTAGLRDMMVSDIISQGFNVYPPWGIL